MMLSASACLAVEGASDSHEHGGAALLGEGAGGVARAPGHSLLDHDDTGALLAAQAASRGGLLGGLLVPAAALLAGMSPLLRVALGVALGGAFILATQAVLDRYEHLKFVGFRGVDARKVLLIMAVMTLHSATEGVGIGVSFGSARERFGVFISATLAAHNVPEGLAVRVLGRVLAGRGQGVAHLATNELPAPFSRLHLSLPSPAALQICLVLLPRGVPPVEAALWAALTSLPQPLMALPAFLSVQHFLPVLPVGLGFAAGAMTWVALFELLADARAEVGAVTTAGVATAAGAAMLAVQQVLR
jgi:ZIP family zinc transporter